jgi:hypothetical protein
VTVALDEFLFAPSWPPAGADVAEVVFYQEDAASPFTVLKPAAFAAGQLLVAVVVQTDGTLAGLTAPSTGGDVWTQQGSYSEVGTGNSSFAKVWSHPWSGSESASWAFGYTSTVDACLTLLRIIRADTTPVIGVASNTFDASAASMDSPTITPPGANDLLLCTLGVFGNATALVETDPAGMANLGQVQVAGNFMALAVASQQLTSGAATGVRSWTGVTPTGQTAGTFSITVKSAAAPVAWVPPVLSPYSGVF